MQTNKNRTTTNEKSELLDFETKAKTKTVRFGLGKDMLIIGLAILIITLILFAPKVYLANNIYYVSRDISRLQAQQQLLAEAKHKLQLELEQLKIKHLNETLGETY
ncbi:hypothetical protein BKH43_01275 [Helicobacter sp. 13S00401-1]|uniref:hypothetical protein n=1 Tax=Helicobacter sp. 13S00401-1 TaxID=1905758 RepID=UPI000BA6B25F|nr:hypothetical protein [Helicobacter sp. 13S00401-1]PAF51891.1 hypothetical protein BKH43_01275 [Helicobacter sp. 13S00401-1]